MIPHSTLEKIVERMVADTGERGIQEMCASVGIEWKGVTDTLTHNFGRPDGNPRHPSQLAMDVLMLGASIGYLFAKGENIHEDGHDSIV